MTRPVIGITASVQQARWDAWEARATLLPQAYVDQVAAAGGLPVVLPTAEDSAELAGRLDGLILSGGGDIHPDRYGAAPHPRTHGVHPDRDASELALLDAVLQRSLPVLGICRGVQVLNVALGGTLHQHLPDLVGHEGHAPEPGAYAKHEVRLLPGSRLAAALGRERVTVPTHHHQGVDALGLGLVAVAWADDGTVEAVELEAAAVAGDGPFVVGVQWHPEVGDDPTIFRAFVEACR